MSRYASNMSCEMCHQIEKSLCKIRIGSSFHFFCYDCAAKLIADLADFAVSNLTDELAELGVKIELSRVDKSLVPSMEEGE